MFPTPDVSHVTQNDVFRQSVYEPAEDTFALLDALEADVRDLQKQQPRLVVEIGCGSGCVSTFAAKFLGLSTAAFLCTDINPSALEATRETGHRNGNIEFDLVQTSLVQALMQRSRGQIDLLLFNPPYVPTSDVEEQMAQHTAAIQGTWAGGAYGRRLLDDLLPQLSDLLAPHGRFYLVAVKQNDPKKIVQALCAQGFNSEICLDRRAGREHLFIIRSIKS